MTERPLVRLLTTGGTIATTRDDRGRTAPSLPASRLAEEIGDVPVRVQATELALLPSWQLGAPEMLEVAVAASEAASNADVAGVVVTHGTTTLEYTAFLCELIYAGEAPIVFTGAMRRADADEPDGPGNLRNALEVAQSTESRGLGVIVCFAGQLLAARTTWKRHRTDPDAFEDVEGPIGFIDRGKLRVVRRPARRPGALMAGVVPGVALVKAHPGADTAALDAVVADGTPGIVIEALPGSGGIPPGMIPGVKRAAEAGVPVVVASRSPVGRMPDKPTGGTGEPLRNMQLISAGDLSAEKAWVLLSVALGQRDGRSAGDVFRAFATKEE